MILRRSEGPLSAHFNQNDIFGNGPKYPAQGCGADSPNASRILNRINQHNRLTGSNRHSCR